MRVKISEARLAGLLGVEFGDSRRRDLGAEIEVEFVAEASASRRNLEDLIAGRRQRPRPLSAAEARIELKHAHVFGRRLGRFTVALPSDQLRRVGEALVAGDGGSLVEESAAVESIEVNIPAEHRSLFTESEAIVVREALGRLGALAMTRLATDEAGGRRYAAEVLDSQITVTDLRRDPRQRAGRVLGLLASREAELAAQPALVGKSKGSSRAKAVGAKAEREARRSLGVDDRGESSGSGRGQRVTVTEQDIAEKHERVFGRRVADGR